MWIDRPNKKTLFINTLMSLEKQVLMVRGARQVGKTSFIINVLQGLTGHPQLKLNLLYPTSFRLDGIEYLGRDFFGRSEGGEEFLKNIEGEFGNLKAMEGPAIIFVDEVDRYPPALEAIQALAEVSNKLKFVFTGSNLENIPVKNAATGRKRYFDLYPITFREFVVASGDGKLANYLDHFSLRSNSHTEFFHNRAREFMGHYLRIGGMPKIIAAYLDGGTLRQSIPEMVKDLAVSIEENVKTVLGNKAGLYEYEDVLRKMAFLSMNTLKYTNLQVQHAGRSEAKKLVSKTVGARVAHKIRLFDAERDLSKYIIFDCGIANYLLSGSDLLRTAINERSLAILYETFVGTEIIASLVTRDDLFYWKSGNTAEVEYLLRSPHFIGIDVKTGKGSLRSLNSLAIFEPDVSSLVKISDDAPSFDGEHIALLPNYDKRRKIALMVIPHYLTFRLTSLLDEVR